MNNNYDYTNYNAYAEQYDVRQPQFPEQQGYFGGGGYQQGYRQGYRDGRRSCQFYGYPGYSQSPYPYGGQTSYPY